MAQDTAELFIAGIAGGQVWMADVGATAPVDLAAPGTGWTDMGYLSEDGFGVTPGMNTEDIHVWPLMTTARTVVTEQSLEFKLAFAQWNADTLAWFYGGAWTTSAGGTKRLSVPLNRATDKAMLIDAQDGDRTYRYILEHASLSDFEEVTHKLGEVSLLGFTLKVLPASDTEWFALESDDPAILVGP